MRRTPDRRVLPVGTNFLMTGWRGVAVRWAGVRFRPKQGFLFFSFSFVYIYSFFFPFRVDLVRRGSREDWRGLRGK
jgi:hypothetical protein